VALMKLTKEERMMFSTRWRGTGWAIWSPQLRAPHLTRATCSCSCSYSNTAAPQRTTWASPQDTTSHACLLPGQAGTQHNNKRARAPHKKKKGNRVPSTKRRSKGCTKIETLKQELD
jgi:hypothetical protein